MYKTLPLWMMPTYCLGGVFVYNPLTISQVVHSNPTFPARTPEQIEVDNKFQTLARSMMMGPSSSAEIIVRNAAPYDDVEMKERIMAFIIGHTDDLARGQWTSDPCNDDYEVGIGRHSGNPGIANQNYHIEIVGNDLVILDKNNGFQPVLDADNIHTILQAVDESIPVQNAFRP